jgi:V/A-type H+-transporting ATPase subunit A
MIQDILLRDCHFRNKEQVRDFYTRLTGLFKNLNYAPRDSEDYESLRKQIEQLDANSPT